MDTSDNTNIEQTEQQQQQQQQQPLGEPQPAPPTVSKSGQVGARLQNSKERQARQKYEQS